MKYMAKYLIDKKGRCDRSHESCNVCPINLDLGPGLPSLPSCSHITFDEIYKRAKTWLDKNERVI